MSLVLHERPDKALKLLPSLPLEVLEVILEHINGDFEYFKRICMTNKSFRDWGARHALKHWPRLRKVLQARGLRICETCCRALPAKTWIELGPGYWTLETSCIDCRIQVLCNNFEKEFDSIKNFGARHPRKRVCMCCICDYGAMMQLVVQSRLAKSAIFCRYCEERIRGAVQATKETAKICKKKYRRALDGDMDMVGVEQARKTSERDVGKVDERGSDNASEECLHNSGGGDTEMADVGNVDELRDMQFAPGLSLRSGHRY